jgi:hypothetical protein
MYVPTKMYVAVPNGLKKNYSLRPIILFINTDVSKYIFMVDTFVY